MYTYSLEVTKVYDGDTVYGTVDLGFSVYTWQKFRLLGINTPEIRTRDLEEKAAGYAARDWLKKQITEAKEVRVKSEGKGKYGRWLAVLYIDGRNINEEMLSNGMAKPY